MLPKVIRELIMSYYWSHWRYIRIQIINESIVGHDFDCLAFLLQILRLNFFFLPALLANI